MDEFQARRAVAAARSTARGLGLEVADTVVIYNSDRIAVRLIPCDVLARVAPQPCQDEFRFEAAVARRLAETGSPVGALEPLAGSRVYVEDGFALTLWRYYEPMGEIAPANYADALIRLHAGLRQLDLAAPHISERITAWVAELENPEQNPDLAHADREFLSTALHRIRSAIGQPNAADQLLHGEPHPGNLLSTSSGPRFIDFHTCQRGPVEYDIAFLPEDAAARYPGVNQAMVQQFRALMWAGFTTMRWRARDQFPDRDLWRAEGFNRLRAALERA
jgi:Ser/Thr protein kinase RdoA (MazF antagonist)